MAKKGKAPHKLDVSKHVTKRRLARWQREKRRQRITTTLGVLVIALVLAIIGYGLYATGGSLADKWVTTVGNTSFVGDDYAHALKLLRLNLYQSSGNEQEDPITLIENNELVKQGMAEAGIIITGDEIDQEIRASFETEGELTDEEFEQLYQQALTNMGLSDEEFRQVMTAILLQTKLIEYLAGEIPQSAEQVHLQAILVETEEDAAVVVERLDGGEDFASLAEEYGGGDGGWLPRGIMGEEFDEIAFTIDIGEASDPLSSSEGYVIIKVLEKEERAIDEEMRQQIEMSAFNNWLAEEREGKVERNPDLDVEEMYQWAIGQID